jgi:hypothetical protein
VTRMTKFSLMTLVFAASCFPLGDFVMPSGSGLFLSQAEARIGRPLTPMSYAGVARRTTRRAVTYGAAVGAATVYSAGCVQRVDAYGRLYYACP